ncbi:hypothetical protein [Fontibacillus sp. BL9]|uniref:hypothetical protein n=1 Tax=Fontibacillus sp. BL9 TaxID=3389971 RepID=UPI0039781E31
MNQSAAMFLSRSAAKSENGKPRLRLYVRRLTILLAVGVIHQFFQSGEALFYYAAFGLLALPLYYASRRVNLCIGLIGTVIGIAAMWWAAPSEPMPTFLYAVEGMETPPVLQATFNLSHIGVAIGPIVLSSLLLLNRTRAEHDCFCRFKPTGEWR